MLSHVKTDKVWINQHPNLLILDIVGNYWWWEINNGKEKIIKRYSCEIAWGKGRDKRVMQNAMEAKQHWSWWFMYPQCIIL